MDVYSIATLLYCSGIHDVLYTIMYLVIFLVVFAIVLDLVMYYLG